LPDELEMLITAIEGKSEKTATSTVRERERER